MDDSGAGKRGHGSIATNSFTHNQRTAGYRHSSAQISGWKGTEIFPLYSPAM